MTLHELRTKAIEALSKTPAYRAADDLAQEHLIITYMEAYQSGNQQGWKKGFDQANKITQQIISSING